MTKRKSTKRALLLSALSLLLCVSMLIGSTFAWFTDSVTSGRNQIVAGNLDVELEYSTDMFAWDKVESETNIFNDEALWEPGYTEVVYLRVSNMGSLALKYKLGINIADEIIGKAKDNNDIKLSDYIEYGIVEDVTAAYGADERMTARADIGTAAKLNSEYKKEFALIGKTETATDADTFALVVYMPESVGNEANHNGTDIPVINLGLTVYATQDTVEKDSFDDQYDADAEYEKVQLPAKNVTVTSPEDLKTALAEALNGEQETIIDATGVTADITEVMANGTAAAFEIPAGVTIKGATFNPTHRGGNYILMGAGADEQVVFENCNFDNAGKNLVIGSTVDGPDSVIYNNCTFTGSMITNFVDNPVGVAEFNGCTFKKATSGITSRSFVEGMGGTHNFNNCTFDYTGVTQSSMGVISSACVNVYSESEYSTTVVLNGCTRINCGTRTYGPNSSLVIK